MAENKTKPTDASVEDYIASRANEQQHSDCQELMALLKKITRQPPKMWPRDLLVVVSRKELLECSGVEPATGEAELMGNALAGVEELGEVSAHNPGLQRLPDGPAEAEGVDRPQGSP